MYCNNCGKQIADGTAICPECGTQLAPAVNRPQPVTSSQPAEPIYIQPPVSEPAPAVNSADIGKVKKPANPKAKGYAAIASALLAFPTLICLVTDYLGAPAWVHWIFDFLEINVEQIQPGHMDWSLYFLGLIMCLWMAIVLPVMKPKRPAVTVCICLAVISLYMLLLAYINSSATWYVQWILPVFLMITISSAIMSILISYKIIKGNHIATAIGVQAALISIGLEIVGDMNIYAAVNLRWSLIVSVVIVGAVLIYEAASYAARLNRK